MDGPGRYLSAGAYRQPLLRRRAARGHAMMVRETMQRALVCPHNVVTVGGARMSPMSSAGEGRGRGRVKGDEQRTHVIVPSGATTQAVSACAGPSRRPSNVQRDGPGAPVATVRTDQRLARVPFRAASASSSVFAPFVRQGTQGDDLRRQILQVERFREETGVATLPILRKVLGG